MTDDNSINLLKIREESNYLELVPIMEEDGKFLLSNNAQAPTWLPTGEKGEIALSGLRSGIKPWLTSLFQSKHF